MKKIFHLRKTIAGIACFCVMMLGFVQLSFTQDFISRESRPRWFDRYENFSFYDLRKYPQNLLDAQKKQIGGAEGAPEAGNPVWYGPADPVTFDQFGNFLLPGGEIFALNWDKSAVGSDQVYGDNAANIFNNLMISSDEISNWQTRFMVGNNLRAFFTPSTFKRTNFDGVRWDLSSRKNSVTFLASAADDNKNLFGAYWQSILGDVLKLGGTFVVQQRGTQKYSNKDISRGVTGLSEIDMERYVYVVITDDSPESETSGAIVYEVKAIIDGKETPIPQRAFKIPDIMNIHKYSGGKWNDEFLFPRHGDSQYAYIPEIVENYESTDGSWFINLVGDSALKQLFNKSHIGSSSLI